jgi:hypothetical protein
MDDAFVQEKPRKTPALQSLLVSLKIGSSLTSAWVATGGGLLFASHMLDTPGKVFFGGLSLAFGIALSGLRVSLLPKPPRREPSPTELRLNKMIEKISEQYKVRARVHFLDEDAVKGNWFGLQWGENIFINKQKYDQLELREGFFPIIHEVVHAYKKDHITVFFGDVAKNASLAFIPLAGLGASVSYLAGQSPGAAALSAAIGVAGATLLHGTTRVFNNIANRIREDRADDIDLEITHDPISAISAIDKLLIHEERNFLQKLTADTPSREDRILNVVEYFNSKWPDRAIGIIDGKAVRIGKENVQDAVAVLDATKVDQHLYVLRKDGISPDPLPV